MFLLGLNLVGDGLRDLLDPKAKRQAVAGRDGSRDCPSRGR
jgi:hypothetical protein